MSQTFPSLIKTYEKVRNNTGLVSKETLDMLSTYLSPKADQLRYWTGTKKTISTKVLKKFSSTPKKSGPNRKLTAKQELELVLMKLRLGVPNHLLATLFAVSSGTCSQVINTWIRFLAIELRPLIFWPDPETLRKLLPPSLASKFPRLRCTIDCTEIFIECPRDLQLQALTWSDYKKHNTAKLLVAIAPKGMISFVSKTWGGRTSDKYIVASSGFVDLLDPGDVVLADRGFPIQEELLIKQARLEIPPPGSGVEQQTAAAVRKTKKVANARIHVERAIGRLKWFAILKNTLPISLVPQVDDIVTICAALCNLLPPLVTK